MQTKLVTILFVIVGLVNFLPLAGVMGVEALQSAYGVAIEGNDVTVLITHRAVLFGIVGGFILYSAIRPAFRMAAAVMALVSMISFVALTMVHGPVNGELSRLATIDMVAIFLCLVAVAGQWQSGRP